MRYDNGTPVTIDIYDAGPAHAKPVGTLEGIVIQAGKYESEVMLMPTDDNLEEARLILPAVGVEMADIVQGPVFVLGACNNDWLKPFRFTR